MNKESNKRNGAQFRARTSENQTKQSQVSFITNRVMPAVVLNRFIRLRKFPKTCQKISKRIRNQTNATVLNSDPGQVKTKQSKVKCPS